MINDKGRNNAYFSAIKLAIDDGSFVLEIGIGSGLLSMMAAANGAEKVVNCEISRMLAETAKKIIDSNSYGEKLFMPLFYSPSASRKEPYSISLLLVL